MSSESSSGCAPGESWETAPEDTHGNPSLEFFFFPNLLRTLKGLAAKPPQHAKRVNVFGVDGRKSDRYKTEGCERV